VIDESHNFRNSTKGARDENGKTIKKSRYEKLLEDIINAGVKTKVLLLSATPVNNDLSDLRNQLMLISGGEDHAFSESLGVSSLNNVLKAAQREFNTWASTEPRMAEQLLEKLSASFFSLLDGLTLARSRKHIKDYYPETIEKLGGFPTRLKPIAVFSDVDTKHFFPSYDAIHEQISGYKLALFSPSGYLYPEFTGRYDTDAVKNFSQANRERYLIGMMKVNFLKRLESSVNSFAITLERTCAKITTLIQKLEAFQTRKDAGEFESLDDAQLEPDAMDDEELEAALQVGKRIKYDLRHLNVDQWLVDLRADEQQLHDVLDVAKSVTAARDAKLADLKALLEEKVKNPTLDKNGQANRKVLVFTAFSDTATYLYQNLEKVAKQLGVHIALVTGSAGNASTLGRVDYNAILTNFSPTAKNRKVLKNFPQDTEIDILIATDCISEGQNLQDCDYLINFDIHWNPVRLIQRFGRIDRIGSQSTQIQMVNFWATPDLNAYLNLKNRVEARMALVDITATSQDNPLSLENIRADLSYRDKQLLRMKDEVLDLEDIEGGVSLSDFSLDDFRMDLTNFLDSNRAALENAPQGIFGLVNEEGNLARHGIVFCLRQSVTGNTGSVANTDLNPLSPYFLVYVRASGEVRFAYAQAKQTLELYRALCANKSNATQTLHDHFDTLTNNLENLEQETTLLKAALESIRTTFKKRANQTLFTGRGAVMPKLEEQVTEETEFDLVTWLAILENPEGGV
jgi:SNF2 family DNA or RNA helicase